MTFTQTPVETLDHDFPSAGQGKLIPHGIYDLMRNEGYMHLNMSHDTSQLCCDSMDCGGSSMAAAIMRRPGGY